MKRILALLLASCILLPTLAACNKKPADDANKGSEQGQGKEDDKTKVEPTGVFNNYFLADVDTLNPHIYTMSDSASVFLKSTMLLYAQFPTEDGKAFVLGPELAADEPKQVDEEGLKWEIKIRENCKWENGDAINIDDLIYSWQMCLDPKMVNSRASQLASDYITIVNAEEYYLQGTNNNVSWDDVGIKRVDDYTVGLELAAPVTADDIKNHFNYAWTCLVHKATYEANMSADRTTTTYGASADKLVSCGMYKLSNWLSGSQFTFERNPDYPLADKVSLAGYVYKIVGDRNTALELFLNGELDVVSLSPESIEQYLDDPRVQEAPSSSIQSLAINHGNTNNNAILGNANFRRALFYAIDRQSIAKMTNGIPANYIVPQKCLGLDGKTFREMPEAQAYLSDNNGFDAAKAKEYYDKAMQECGLTSLKLTLQYNESSANNKAASEFLHTELPKIFGDTFTLDLLAAPTSVLNEYIKGWKNGDPNSFELQWRGWNTSTSAPWNGMKVYTSMYTNKNEPYSNAEYDALWNEANYDLKAKLDPAYRLELTRKMEQIALDEVAVCSVYEAPGYYLIGDRVTLPSDGYIPGYGFGYDLAKITEEK